MSAGGHLAAKGLSVTADGAFQVSKAALEGGIVLAANHPLVASSVAASCGAGCYTVPKFLKWWRAKPFVRAQQPQGLHFGAFDEPMYRSAEGLAYGIVPVEVTLPSGFTDLSQGTIKFNFVLKTPVDAFPDESIISGSPLPVLFLAPPKYMFEVCVPDAAGTGLISVGLAVRAGWHMLTARHLFFSKDKMAYGARSVFLRLGDRQVEAFLSDPVDLLEKGDTQETVKGTYKDIVAYEFGQMVWTKLGARSLKTTDITHQGEGSVEVAGRPCGDLMVSRGCIVPDPETEAQRGVLTYTASTTFAYSGGPVLFRDCQAFKFGGIHIGGGLTVNYAASMPGVRQLLRKIHFGVQPTDPLWRKLTNAGAQEIFWGVPLDLSADTVVNESREKWRRQAELRIQDEAWAALAAKEQEEDDAQARADKDHYEAYVAAQEDAFARRTRAEENQQGNDDFEKDCEEDRVHDGGGPSKRWDDEDHRVQKGYEDSDDDYDPRHSGAFKARWYRDDSLPTPGNSQTGCSWSQQELEIFSNKIAEAAVPLAPAASALPIPSLSLARDGPPPLLPPVFQGYRAKIEAAKSSFNRDLAAYSGSSEPEGGALDEPLTLDFDEESPSAEEVDAKASVVHDLMMTLQEAGRGVHGYLRRDETRVNIGRKWHALCINRLIFTGRVKSLTLGGVDWLMPVPPSQEDPRLVEALLSAAAAQRSLPLAKLQPELQPDAVGHAQAKSESDLSDGSSDSDKPSIADSSSKFSEESRSQRRSRKQRETRRAKAADSPKAGSLPTPAPKLLGPSAQQQKAQHPKQQPKKPQQPRKYVPIVEPIPEAIPGLPGFVEQSPPKSSMHNTWLPLQDRKRLYARSRAEKSAPLPASQEPAKVAAAALYMDKWMSNKNWHSLMKLEGVGAKTLLEMPALSQYIAYMQVGNVNTVSTAVDAHPTITGINGQPVALMVGTCEATRGRRKPLREIRPEFLAALEGMSWKGKDLLSQVAPIVAPPSGPEAVKQSLRANCARLQQGDWTHFLEDPEFNTTFQEFVSAYPETQAFTLGSLDQRIESYLDSMDATKSAGWSSRYLPGTKGAWREQPDLVKYLVMCRIALRIAEGDNLHYLGAEDMVSIGLRDPEEVAIKDEGNGESKRKAGRWRMIWITSIIDSICQEIMHHDQNKADIQAYSDGKLSHQAVGLGHDDDGIQKIGRLLEQLSGGVDDINSSDIEAWDYSVPRDAIYFDAERRVCLLKDRVPYYHELAENPRWVQFPMANLNAIAAKCLYAEAAVNSAHLVVVGEELWTFDEFGITASGIPSTSAQNSPQRSFTLKLAGSKTQSAAGDDGLHTGKVCERKLAAAGQRVKPGSASTSPPGGPVGFTSHEFTRLPGGKWRATFDNLPKLIAHMDLRRKDGEPPAQDALSGMAFALRHTPEALDIFHGVCSRVGWEVPVAEPHEWD